MRHRFLVLGSSFTLLFALNGCGDSDESLLHSTPEPGNTAGSAGNGKGGGVQNGSGAASGSSQQTAGATSSAGGGVAQGTGGTAGLGGTPAQNGGSTSSAGTGVSGGTAEGGSATAGGGGKTNGTAGNAGETQGGAGASTGGQSSAGSAGAESNGGVSASAGEGGSATSGASGSGGTSGTGGTNSSGGTNGFGGTSGSSGMGGNAGETGAGGVAGGAGDAGNAGDAGSAGTGGNEISVQVCPETTLLNPGDALVFSATVEGSNVQNVSWSAPDGGTIDVNGHFVAPNTPGSYKVVATSVVNPTSYSVSEVRVVQKARPVVSGSVSYMGLKTGRMFVHIDDWPRSSTVVGEDGTFAIRGSSFAVGQQVTVRAYMDTLGIGNYVLGADPSGSATVTSSGSDITELTIQLLDPGPQALTAPTKLEAYLSDGVAIVGWDGITAGNAELAERYRVYTGTSADIGPGKANVRSDEVRAGISDLVVLDSLSKDTSYYFAVAGVQAGVEGPLQVIGPIAPNNPSGGSSISGDVALPGITPQGPLYVFAHDETLGAFFTRINSPLETQPFTIQGVTDGVFSLGAILKQVNGSELAPTDLVTFRSDEARRRVTVAGANISGQLIKIPSGDVLVKSFSQHVLDTPGEHYKVELEVGSHERIAIKSTLLSGPGIQGQPALEGPIDMGIGSRDAPLFRYSHYLSTSAKPTLGGEPYVFNVMYDDGITCNAQATAPNAFLDLPLSPLVTNANSGVPSFSWQAPATTPTIFQYEVRVWKPGAQEIWFATLVSSATSVAYNADGSASAPTLASGNYGWEVSIVDSDRNLATVRGGFSVP